MFLRIILAATLLCLLGCSDFIHPVKSTPEPESEYAFNYWLLQKVFLYEERLADLPKDGDSDSIQQQLYSFLKDPYTSYTPPAKSEERSTIINTSKIIGGDVGMRYTVDLTLEHPIKIARVYPISPAGQAGVPRDGNILKVNDIDLTGEKAKATYDSVLSYTKNIDLVVAYKGDTTLFKLEKETVYAPTVFVDTLYEDSAKGYPGIIFVSIEGFKDSTANRKLGTFGELKSYLDSTTSDKRVRVLDLRNNPGGLVKQSLKMADLFVSKGTMSTMRQRAINDNGESIYVQSHTDAKAGDIGESGKFIILTNGGTASAAEIFTAAVTETTDIPHAGVKTYGKGVGQTTYFTYAGGMATITNFEFLTPKGNSYHKKGIQPKFDCSGTITENCVAQVAYELYGVKSPAQDASLAKRALGVKEYSGSKSDEGAVIWADADFYLKAFEKSIH